MSKLILILFFVLISNFSYIQAEIVVRISADKSEYLEVEPIICTLSFINNSEFSDSIDYDKLGLYYIKVYDHEKKKLQYNGGHGDWIGGARYRLIKPNDTISDSFILSELFANTILSYSINSAPGYLTSGAYTIQYNYSNILLSNEIIINIIEPTGIEKIVFDKLVTAYLINDMNHSHIDSIFIKQKFYYEIARSYPESIYWEEAVFRYNQVSRWLNLAYTDISINKEFIERFPNSIYVKHILNNLCRAIYHYEGGDSVVIIYLQKLIENYPKSNVSRAAKDQMLKKGYLN
jgi:hypothetical protein